MAEYRRDALMLKLLGCVLLAVCGWGVGTYLGVRDKRRITHGEALVDMVRFIRAQIASFCRPKTELYRLYEDPRLHDTGFSDILATEGEMEAALAALGRTVDREMVTWMTAFDREIGRGDADAAIAVCDYYTARMEVHLAARQAAHPSRARVWRTVTTAGALLTALLLL